MTFTLWFMGRPASGKSTLAKRIESRLRDRGLEPENLDGDDLRKHLHPELGFSREERAVNNRRTAYICKLLNRNEIPVVNAMITPFRDAQQRARDIIEPDGTFILVHVKCSMEECERRDPKKLYEEARAGNVENFTGVNHPFQDPNNPDIIVNTENQSIDDSLDHVLTRLEELNVLEISASSDYDFKIGQSRESKIKDRLEDLGYEE